MMECQGGHTFPEQSLVTHLVEYKIQRLLSFFLEGQGEGGCCIVVGGERVGGIY